MTATVVHVQRPASVEPGNVALVLADGTIEGFVGGVCSEHSVRAYALQALAERRVGAAADPAVLRGRRGQPEPTQLAEDGAVVVQNPCLSGGVIEVFLEPVLPAPRVLVVGDTPTAEAVLRIGAELGLDAVNVQRRRLRAAARRSRAGRRGARPRRAAHAAPRPRGRPARTSASSPARSAAPACSPSCAATASPTSSSRASTCPRVSTSVRARPPRSRSRSWRKIVAVRRDGRRGDRRDALRRGRER